MPIGDFLRELGVSLATFKRDVAYMRTRHHAPIVFDRERGGYSFQHTQSGAAKYQLPGLWFSPREAQALLTMEHLLESLEPSLLGAHVKPLAARLSALLSAGDRRAEEVRRRIRIIAFGQRRHEPHHFQLVASAVLGRERLKLTYWNRMSDETTQREVSPQRLVFYRNNWYLDAWCHMRHGLRSFSLDAMRNVSVVAEKTAREVPDKELDEVMQSGYGIFSGKKVRWAVLRFSPAISRYVSLEEWHPRQRARFDKDGSYVLEVPMSSDKELLMDILKYGADVEVVAPPRLRSEAARRLKRAAEKYRRPKDL
ncbi:MAG TPA: WYL domain-containing protein [Usitatibacter sp.]|nr:WYL domain-containing protein [Usitatibacter sp.]